MYIHCIFLCISPFLHLSFSYIFEYISYVLILSTDRFTLFTFPGWSVLVRRRSFLLAQKWNLLLFPWACFGVPTGGPQPQAAPKEK